VSSRRRKLTPTKRPQPARLHHEDVRDQKATEG